jgi:hypothetical protein
MHNVKMTLFSEDKKLNATQTRVLGLLLGVALLIRILAVLLAPSWYSTDSQIYSGMAELILQGIPDPRLPNGLPLLEAGLMLLLGDKAILGLMAINVLASVTACYLVFLVARRCFGIHTAWLALLVMLIYPHTLNYVRYELTETISATLLLAAFWWLMRERFLLAGLTMGILWIFRTSMLPVGILVALALLLLPYAQHRWPAVARYAGGFFIIWMLQFALVKMHVVKMPSNFAENIYLAISAPSSEGINYEEGPGLFNIKDPIGLYTRFMREHPSEWARQRLSSLWELVGPWPSAGHGLQARGTVSRLLIGMRFGLLLLALGAAWRIRDRWTLLLFLPLVGIAILHCIFFSEPRFLVPVEPFLMILATAFCVRLCWPKKEFPLQATADQPSL